MSKSDKQIGPCIEINNLIYQYKMSDTPVVNISNWCVEQGEHLFLRGESGSGKSTLIHLLAGLSSPTSGNIKINGFDISASSVSRRDRFRAKNIGLVYQQFNLIPYLSMLDNVLLSAHFASGDTRQSTQLACELLEKMNLPSELHARDARHLSIGQQQRVAISRAMINQPNLVLVDEPTSALDKNNRDRFMELLFDLLKEFEATLVFVSHDESLASLFTNQVELNEINEVSNLTNLVDQGALK